MPPARTKGIKNQDYDRTITTNAMIEGRQYTQKGHTQDEDEETRTNCNLVSERNDARPERNGISTCFLVPFMADSHHGFLVASMADHRGVKGLASEKPSRRDQKRED